MSLNYFVFHSPANYYDDLSQFSAALLGARFRSADTSDDDGDGNSLDIPAGCNMGRRRSRAVLYQLSGHYKPEKIKTKIKLNSVSCCSCSYAQKANANVI